MLLLAFSSKHSLSLVKDSSKIQFKLYFVHDFVTSQMASAWTPTLFTNLFT